MRPVPTASLLSTSVWLLACTGLLGEPTDSGDTGGGSSAIDDDPEPWEQTDDCDAWLDCLEAVDEAAWDDAQSQYGEDGSCWGTDDDVATDCDDYCESQFEQLAEEYPDEPDCGGEAGDTGADTGNDTGGDTGSGQECVLDAGVWLFQLEWVVDDCGAGGEWTEQIVDVTCSGGAMEMSFDILDVYAVTLECEEDGREFMCGGGDSVIVNLGGKANSAGTTATGTVVMETDWCTSEGMFDGALD